MMLLHGMGRWLALRIPNEAFPEWHFAVLAGSAVPVVKSSGDGAGGNMSSPTSGSREC
jgi:hypothetical protein